MNALLAAAVRPYLETEGKALAFLDNCRYRLGLRDSTVDLLRKAVTDHFDQIADTVRSPEAAAAFCGEFCAMPVDGEQAPSTPVTLFPPARSDAGFPLDD